MYRLFCSAQSSPFFLSCSAWPASLLPRDSHFSQTPTDLPLARGRCLRDSRKWCKEGTRSLELDITAFHRGSITLTNQCFYIQSFLSWYLDNPVNLHFMELGHTFAEQECIKHQVWYYERGSLIKSVLWHRLSTYPYTGMCSTVPYESAAVIPSFAFCAGVLHRQDHMEPQWSLKEQLGRMAFTADKRFVRVSCVEQSSQCGPSSNPY